MSICVYSSIWDGDAHWADQYLSELERLNLPFMMHFDRCSQDLKVKIRSHRLCAGSTDKGLNPEAFDERDKQGVFDLVAKAGFRWGLAMDVDETWERDFLKNASQVLSLPNDVVRVITHWKNLWEDQQHIRIDGPFAPGACMGMRKKFYRVDTGINWKYKSPINNGPYPEDCTTVSLDITCLHWGFMRKEWRQQHKKTWDHNYTTTNGSNPYGSWNHTLDESITPILENNIYI